MNDIQTFSRRADRITDGARRRVDQYTRRFKIIFDGWYNDVLEAPLYATSANYCLRRRLGYDPGWNPKERRYELYHTSVRLSVVFP